MSYCRFSEADVYVFMSVGGWLECCACILEPEESQSRQFHSTSEMIIHLYDHKKAGHHVPEDAIKRLWDDDKKNFPESYSKRREAMDELIRLTEELRAADPELFDANEHWINNPLISPKSKVHHFEEWEKRVRKEERERIRKVAEGWISEMRGHDGECDCTHNANVLNDFINHDEFRGNPSD